MKVTHIEDNTYRVELSNSEQAEVELTAEQSLVDNVAALESIIIDGFDLFIGSTD